MTRRIAVAILLTVWAILIAAGIGAYLVTRSVLLANLDDSIVERAAAVPEITDAEGRKYVNTSPMRADDRFIVRNPINQTLTRLEDVTNDGKALPRPQVLSASFFTMPDGQRIRTLTLKAYAKPVPPTTTPPTTTPPTTTPPTTTPPTTTPPTTTPPTTTPFGVNAEHGSDHSHSDSGGGSPGGEAGGGSAANAAANGGAANGAIPKSANVVVPVTIFFRGSAERFDRLTQLLGLTLAGCGVAGAVLSAGIAWLVARAALRPLRSTAEVIGTIDDRALNRRIQTDKLPPELLPVGTRLNGMLERLEQAFANRRRFIADAAHELRTPVAALITTMEVALRRPRDAESYRQSLQTCLSDARGLRGLAESLLTQARAELPAFNEPAEPVELSALLESTTSALSALAEQRGVRLELDLGVAHSPLTLRTQPGRLRSVMMNVVGNAIDHNKPGGRVLIQTTLDSAQLRIEVTDTGPGIAAQHLPHLFDPFYRARPSPRRAEAPAGDAQPDTHMGLGLFLVKTHVEAMGGKCSVRSAPGVGTTFALSLPSTLLIDDDEPAMSVDSSGETARETAADAVDGSREAESGRSPAEVPGAAATSATMAGRTR